jgi:hypothetical protein
MQPDNDLIQNALPRGATARVLAKPGQEYALYVRTAVRKEEGTGGQPVVFANNEITLELMLPAGSFVAEWVDTQSGKATRTESFSHSAGICTLAVPAFTDDIALALRKSEAAPKTAGTP